MVYEFLKGLTDLWGETLIFVMFYAFNCLGHFCGLEGIFMDLMISGDYIAHPPCIGF